VTLVKATLAGQGAVDEFLKMSIVSLHAMNHNRILTLSIQTKNRTKPSYHNKRSLLKKINTLPTGPGWECEIVKVLGDAVDADVG
jgi:hypothetical protein